MKGSKNERTKERKKWREREKEGRKEREKEASPLPFANIFEIVSDPCK
jgi:hypothetical protein